ncbi:hypothetical protein KM043_018720 [Ampulex compressa]|nr:hypothetical protein KM043_018720 [Ampulex compressa]
MSGQFKCYTLEEVAKHDGEKDSRTWIVVEDIVYDVTDYAIKHPGGPELIMEYAGKDATTGFNDFGHSSDARKIMKDLVVGVLTEDDKAANRKKKQKNGSATNTQKSESRKRRTFLSALCGNCVS